MEYPYTHDLTELLTKAAEEGITIPNHIKEAAVLTDYAVQSRYPSPAESVTKEEYKKALTTAEDVLSWATEIVE